MLTHDSTPTPSGQDQQDLKSLKSFSPQYCLQQAPNAVSFLDQNDTFFGRVLTNLRARS